MAQRNSGFGVYEATKSISEPQYTQRMCGAVEEEEGCVVEVQEGEEG